MPIKTKDTQERLVGKMKKPRYFSAVEAVCWGLFSPRVQLLLEG